jgi:hypothetical protein
MGAESGLSVGSDPIDGERFVGACGFLEGAADGFRVVAG